MPRAGEQIFYSLLPERSQETMQAIFLLIMERGLTRFAMEYCMALLAFAASIRKRSVQVKASLKRNPVDTAAAGLSVSTKVDTLICEVLQRDALSADLQSIPSGSSVYKLLELLSMIRQEKEKREAILEEGGIVEEDEREFYHYVILCVLNGLRRLCQHEEIQYDAQIMLAEAGCFVHLVSLLNGPKRLCGINVDELILTDREEERRSELVDSVLRAVTVLTVRSSRANEEFRASVGYEQVGITVLEDNL